MTRLFLPHVPQLINHHLRLSFDIVSGDDVDPLLVFPPPSAMGKNHDDEREATEEGANADANGKRTSSLADVAPPGASVGGTVVITSATSTTGLADAVVPATGRAEVAPADLAGLLHAQAAVLHGMVEGRGYEEEEKREEGEDDEALRQPSGMAASCEEIDAADHKASVDPQVPEERNDGTPVNTENQGSLFGPSSSLNQQPSTASNVQVCAPSITTTPSSGDQRSMGLADNDQGHVVGMRIRPAESPSNDFVSEVRNKDLLSLSFTLSHLIYPDSIFYLL